MAVASFRSKVLPVGVVQGVVDADAFLVRVSSQDYGTIEIFMTSADDVSVGQEIYVIPLAGGRIVGASKDLRGLGENFLEKEGCRTALIP